MYGADYPCWDPASALALLDKIDLSEADQQKLFHDNAGRILNLRGPGAGAAGAPAREPAMA